MNTLIKFEIGSYFKQPGFHLLYITLAGLGFFIGHHLSFGPGELVHKNAPYNIAYMTGLLSLICIFTSTLLAAQHLFKEKDHRFSLILYATPLKKSIYLWSRYATVFLISLFYFLTLLCGYIIGHAADPELNKYALSLTHYLNPFLILAVPNLFFCSAVICSVAWLGKNKLLVYCSGLFIYISYMVILLFSGSPLMAGALPISAEAMELSAKMDPFGLSAFYLQTNHWTILQRNTELVQLTGNLLANRLLYIFVSCTFLLIAFRRFTFSITEKNKKKEIIIEKEQSLIHVYQPERTFPAGIIYELTVIKSFVKLDLKFILKSIPFWLITVGILFYMSMEIYTSIDQGIRIPQQYASTALMVNRIISNLPGMLLLVLLFYAQEIFWQSSGSHFSIIENSTAVSYMAHLIAKWCSLFTIMIVIITITILLGIVFQFIFQYPFFEWATYASIYWLTCAPLLISVAIILCVHAICPNKWVGLILSSIIIFILATSLGQSLGITHPLLRFQSAFTGRYSELSGWSGYLHGFSWRMMYGMTLTLLLVSILLYLKSALKKSYYLFGIAALLMLSILSGSIILKHSKLTDDQSELDWQYKYEQHYRKFQHLPQPHITKVKTTIDLFPAQHTYQVSATYTLQNKTTQPIYRILINFSEALKITKAHFHSSTETIPFTKTIGFIDLQKAFLPGNTASFQFSFSYHWDGFSKLEPFNAIVENGAFIRISNYFPQIGYQTDLEIADDRERKKRNLGPPTPLCLLDGEGSSNDNFIQLDMIVSTAADQTAIGIGELSAQWNYKNRNYFRYKTNAPVPFRFAVSSAVYAIKKIAHAGKRIEVFYHPSHHENIDHLIENAKLSLDYCQQHFSSYPFHTIRFAEISSYTYGFAGTAYPATIFAPEHMVFHANIKADEQQDVINELASHELSHQWWGANQLVPDEREGSKFLTETLAMYTELMLAKKQLKNDRVLDIVKMHLNMYLNERGFTEEQPLYKVKPGNTHVYYSKGVVAMYLLSELIGEARVNSALKNLLIKHAYPHTSPISTDFLEEVYAVSDTSTHARIDMLFKSTNPLTDFVLK